MGPEERWEDKELWKEERRLEGEETLSKEEVYDILTDEKFQDGR